MAYPRQSNFSTSADLFSSYWGAESLICTTSPHDLVRQLRRAFRLSDIPVWDADLLRSVASSTGSPVPSSITPDFVRLAIWSAFYRRRGIPIEAVYVAPDASMPSLGVAIAPNPEQRSLGFVCFNPLTDRNPSTLDPAAIQRFDPLSLPAVSQQNFLVPVVALVLLAGVIAVGSVAVSRAGR